VAGVSAAVVLCGSLGSTAAMWRPQAPVLAGREVTSVEHPGHGGEPVPGDVRVETLARRLLEAAPERFVLVGLSLGGAVAAEAAALAPERVEAVVLCCMSTSFGDANGWRERAALVRSEGLEAIVDAVLGRWFTPRFGDVEPYRAMFLSVDVEGYARCCEALATWDGTEALRRIAAPTVVVAGREDPTSPPAHAEAIAALVAGARLALLDDAAHLATVERADLFNPLLEELL
jgi:3-oxoadipate enol-lactonase